MGVGVVRWFLTIIICLSTFSPKALTNMICHATHVIRGILRPIYIPAEVRKIHRRRLPRAGFHTFPHEKLCTAPSAPKVPRWCIQAPKGKCIHHRAGNLLRGALPNGVVYPSGVPMSEPEP